LHPGAVYSYAKEVGRKSRAKSERRRDASEGDSGAAESASKAPLPPPLIEPAAPPKRRARSAPERYPGARIARVAVDDETWDAFRALCGPKPASIRLGELVAAEVEGARQKAGAPPDALAALREIRERTTELERFVRGQ
jgi:hypothetical protein